MGNAQTAAQISPLVKVLIPVFLIVFFFLVTFITQFVFAQEHNITSFVIYFFQSIISVFYGLLIIPAIYNFGKYINKTSRDVPGFIKSMWENPIWNISQLDHIIDTVIGATYDESKYNEMMNWPNVLSRNISYYMKMNTVIKSIVQVIDSVYDLKIIQEEFIKDEEYVNEFMKYVYFATMYIFSIVVLHYKHTDIIGFGFVSILNIIGMMLFSSDLGNIMGPVLTAPLIFVYFPWLVLGAASGFILYIVFRLKWAYDKKNASIKFLKDEQKTYDRMKNIFTAATVITFCMSALFTFERSSEFIRILLVILLIVVLSLDVVILTDATKIYKKDIRHLNISSGEYSGVQQPDFKDQLYSVFQNLNLNFILSRDTDLGL